MTRYPACARRRVLAFFVRQSGDTAASAHARPAPAGFPIIDHRMSANGLSCPARAAPFEAARSLLTRSANRHLCGPGA